MQEIITKLGGLVSKVSEMLDFGEHGSIAATILIILAGVALIGSVLKFIRKKVGTLISIILIIAILFGSGFLSLSQIKNYAQDAGIIYKDGLPNASEEDGKWLIEFFESLAPGKDEGAGTWVPEKNNQSNW